MEYGLFKVQGYGDSSTATRKYKSNELYLLLPGLFPSAILDALDQYYLYCNHAPIVLPLLRSIQIELHNDKWLQSCQSGIISRSSVVNLLASEIDTIIFKPHVPPIIYTITTLRDKLNKPLEDNNQTIEEELTLDFLPIHAKIHIPAE